uniref:ATP-binding protein n=1 Tax=Ornithobacterium rhinotracheale TaxID=28251 RepID=UPI00129D16AB|nr:ATP-binding protein [Ornithobacterium rhinotracheale]
MKIKTKTKITFGVGLLFVLILLLAGMSGWYINKLKSETNNILLDNYNTLLYSRSMLLALDEIQKDSVAIGTFSDNLDKQKQNVTEIGEQETTDKLAQHFNQLVKNPQDSLVPYQIRKDISQMMDLNMQAIVRKSHIADSTALRALIAISVTGVLCFLIAFLLLINLPNNIAKPITELTESIKEIANQNYKKRVHFKNESEFGELATSFNIMAEKLEEYTDSKLGKILEGKRRIETLIDSMHDPVIGIDQDKKVLFVNDEALKITGLRKEDFVGKQIQDVAVMNDLVRDIAKDIVSGKKGSNKDQQVLKIYADDKESYFEKEIVDINIVPTGESASQFIGQVILLKNITPFKELDLAKTNFMGAISHEFKTPLASIKMGVQLLENKSVGELNEEQSNLINGIKEDANRLLKITGELLNITQLDSGSMQLKIQENEVQPIIEYAVNANRIIAEQKQIAVNVEIQPELPHLLVDKEKTAWVLSNLVSNAIRYSYEKSEVKIKAYATGKDSVYIAVEDFGKGIQSQFLHRIFERYFRVPGSVKDGTGLGLSISKELIEAQGGQISVESEYGAGSTFTIELKASK